MNINFPIEGVVKKRYSEGNYYEHDVEDEMQLC